MENGITKLAKEAQAAGEERYTSTGYIPPEDVPAFYQQMTFLYELWRFGMPIVEALTSGTLLSLDIPTWSWSDAILYAQPKNPEDFAERFYLLSNPNSRKEMMIVSVTLEQKNFMGKNEP